MDVTEEQLRQYLGALFLLAVIVWAIYLMIRDDGSQARQFKRFCVHCSQVTDWEESTKPAEVEGVIVSSICQRCKVGQTWVEVRE